MKIMKIIKYTAMSLFACAFCSCSEIDLPEHYLDIEYRYELTCSENVLEYVTPEVTITDAQGNQKKILIDESMWQGSGHKTWSQSVHYDSLGVTNTMTVRYLVKSDVTYKDISGFDDTHNFNCFIFIKEDGDGRRNNYTMIPDYPSDNNVTADMIEEFVLKLTSNSATKGGSVDMKGEITKIEK